MGEESIKKLLKKAQANLARRPEGREKSLVYSWWRKSGVIPYGKIRYIGIRGHNLAIRCTDGRVQESTGKLNDLEQQICGDTLLRCNQSFIVNIYHVEGMSGSVQTVAGERIPVSRRYYAEVKKRYQQILMVMTKRPEDLPAFLLILLLMPMSYATIFAAMYRQLLLHRKRQSERILQVQKSTLEAQLDSQRNIRKMKNDIKGYTATLSGLLSAGKIKEAQEYLAGVEQKMDVLSGQCPPARRSRGTISGFPPYRRRQGGLRGRCSAIRKTDISYWM